MKIIHPQHSRTAQTRYLFISYFSYKVNDIFFIAMDYIRWRREEKKKSTKLKRIASSMQYNVREEIVIFFLRLHSFFAV